MKKSILKGMLFSTLIIVVMTFVVTILTFSKFVQTTSIERETERLHTNIVRINDISRMAFANNNTYMSVIYGKMIDNISYNLDASVIIFNDSGETITVSGIKEKKLSQINIDTSIYADIISGKVISKIGMLDEAYDNHSTLTVGAPLTGNGVIYGGVLISKPISDIMGSYQDVLVKLTFVIIAAILLSVILFYFISRRITTPVGKINKAVNEFAKGNFESRVEYASDDELGELSQNINAMADSLENLEKMRSTFVSDVSHELRTPMTTISGFVEGILDGTIEECDRDKYLGIVLSESKRLSRLVHDLLNLTRVQNKEVELGISEFDIVDLTYQVLLAFDKQLTDKQIEVDTNAPDERVFVKADKDSIVQVLTNLMGNAVKFTPDSGKISIDIAKQKIKTLVSVTNSGKGIEKEKLPYIWDRFYKTDSSRNTDKTGFGLGLCIVKSIIDKHNEKIYVESVPDNYTTFKFTLSNSK